MSEKRPVSIKEIVNDVRSGMPDQELMTKYNLSAKGVQRAFQKLIEMGAISQAEMNSRNPSAADTVFFQSMRELPRHYLVTPIPIHQLGNATQKPGKLRDVTEKGVGVIGVEAKVGETKIFAIYPDDFVSVSSFSFRTVCRWTQHNDHGQFVGGFEITEISDDALEKLRQLIRDLTFGED